MIESFPMPSMLQLFFAVAFSSVPLTLHVPPMRSLNLFIETMEGFIGESYGYTSHALPHLRHGFRHILSALLLVIGSSGGEWEGFFLPKIIFFDGEGILYVSSGKEKGVRVEGAMMRNPSR